MLPRQCSGELYTVLELDSQCTTEQVSQHYRRLALRYHPDRNAGATVEQFQRIEEAHRVLSDPQQRQLYNTVGRDGLKRLGDYGGGMVGSLLLAVGNLAVGCLLLGILSAAFFVSLLIGCYKIDEPSKWPSWGVVLLPLWFLLPLLVLASLVVMVASVRRGLYVLLLPSARLLLLVVMAATTAAALDHHLSAVGAFIPWAIWYVLGTASDVVMMVPTVYRKTHFAEDVAEAATEDAAAGGASPANVDSTPARDADAPWSRHGSFATTPWKTAQYWRDLAELIFETVCVYAFMSLAFQRALHPPSATNARVLSFWVVFTPLLIFFGGHLLVGVLEGYFASPPSNGGAASTSPEEAEVLGQHPNSGTSGAASSPTHVRTATYGERVANILLRSFPPACGLYMASMWAAKAEFEYNGVHVGADPSAFLAFLPILVLSGTLAFFVCCGGCAIICLGTALAGMSEAEAAAQQQQPQQPSPSSPGQPRHGGGRSAQNSPRSEGYQSTASRTPHAPTAGNGKAAGGAAAPPSGRGNTTSYRGGMAKDVAIEQID